MSVHQQRVGRRRVAAGRGIAAAAGDACVPVMRVVRTGQVDEARRRRRTGGRPRLAAERLTRGEAARTAEQAVRMPRLGEPATVRRPALVEQVVDDSPDVAERHRPHLRVTHNTPFRRPNFGRCRSFLYTHLTQLG